MAWLPRTLETTLHRVLRTFPALVVTGPRQSGKTSLLRRIGRSTHAFVSLEDTDRRQLAAADPRRFLRDHPPPLIVDEIQYAPDLLSYIKTAIDQDRKPGRWLMSGSQPFAVMRGVTQSLAGRVAVLELLLLSCNEAAGSPHGDWTIGDLLARLQESEGHLRRIRGHQAPNLANWLVRGGYPEPRANRSIDHRQWCASYVRTYVERDVRTLLRVGDLNDFERFLRLCAARTGQILNLSDLARETGISVPTARSWLSVLEASYTVFLLQPYFRNIGKRLIKAPKLYFIDTALATYLTGLDEERTALRGPTAGALVETAIVGGWRKAFVHRGETPRMYYWRTRDGLEIDLLIEHAGQLHPIEIKATSTVTPGHAASLLRWLAEMGDRTRRGVVFADIPAPVSLHERVQAVPWHWI